MDWSKSNNQKRKDLYFAVKSTVEARGISFAQFYERLTGSPMTRGYNSSLTSGAYDRKKAVLFFEWLANNNPERAIEINDGQSIDAYLNDGQSSSNPPLILAILKDTDETRFVFRSRSIPYINPKDAFEQLDRFVGDDRAFVWHVLSGEGGTGKSRLALEYALKHANNSDVDIGFLSINAAQHFNWIDWQPSKAVFIIIDYAARHSDLVADIILALSEQTAFKHKVRLLLLERELTGAWFSKITQSGSASHPFIDGSWFGEDGTLEPPEDVWPIIEFMARKNKANLPSRDAALTQLARIDPQMRPLYAAFLGDAYFRAQNPRQWSAYDLVENVLEHEKRYWSDGGVRQSHINLCAAATSTAGIMAEWVEPLSRGEMQGFWPEWQGLETITPLSAIYGSKIIDDIPPLEPDILGEVFYLQYWNSASRYERNKLLQYGSKSLPWYGEFLERLISDFPELPTDDLLHTVLKASTQGSDLAKYELLYNLITHLVPSHPQKALAIFKLFGHVAGENLPPYAIECMVDGALNIIVGIDAIEHIEAFGFYNQLKEWTSHTTLSVQAARSWCDFLSSFIGKYPASAPEEFRTVLAHALSCYRLFPNDNDLRRETCAAIANFINLLNETQLHDAIRLLRLFVKLAKGETDNEMQMAWNHILYHVFILHLAQFDTDEIMHENIDKAIAQMDVLVPEFDRHKETVLTSLQKDMAIDQREDHS